MEVNDEDTEMEEAGFPRIRRTKVGKFVDEFDETNKELNALFVNYDTTVPIAFQNLKREINKNA